MDKTVFLSYSHKNKDVADFIEHSFWMSGVKIFRDERDVRYTESIKDFMRRIRRTDYALLIISDDYLKSAYCMYEVLEVVKDDNFRDRILPLVHEVTRIFTPAGRLFYTQYWEKEVGRLSSRLKPIDPVNVTSEYVELHRMQEVLRNVAQFLNTVAYMRCITYAKQITDTDVQTIKERVGLFTDEAQTYYILSKIKTISYGLNSFIWWAPGRKGYTDNLANAGKYTSIEAKDIIDRDQIPCSTTVAIPVALAKRIFHSQEVIPYGVRFLDELRRQEANLMGDLDWDFPENLS
jgi:hypothetical protein